MRRSDREITDLPSITGIINNCSCCRIGFNDGGEVYIVPLNFGFEICGDTYILYFHSAKEGRKINLIAENPNVGFEMDTNYALCEADTACGHSAYYQSITGNGKLSMISDYAEKIHGLELIMEHNTGKNGWSFNENVVRNTAVFKLEVSKMSCKAHR